MSMKTKNGSKGKKAKKSSTTLGNLPFWNAPKPGKINLKKKSVEVITLQRFNESPKHPLILQLGAYIKKKTS